MRTISQYKSDTEEGGGDWKHILYIVILFGFFWLLMRGAQMINHYPDGSTVYITESYIGYGLFFGMFVYMAAAGIHLAKRKSPQIHANGLASSHTGKKPIPAGRFNIVRLGGVNWGVCTDTFSEGTFVYPRSAHNQVGVNITAKVWVQKVDFEELYPHVRKVIEENDLKKPFYFGVCNIKDFKKEFDITEGIKTDEEKEALMKRVGGMKEPDVAVLVNEIRHLNRVCHMYEQDNQNIMNYTSGKIDWSQQNADRGNQNSQLQKILDARKKENER